MDLDLGLVPPGVKQIHGADTFSWSSFSLLRGGQLPGPVHILFARFAQIPPTAWVEIPVSALKDSLSVITDTSFHEWVCFLLHDVCV